MKFKLIESFDDQRYQYVGPTYDEAGIVKPEETRYTIASSRAKAINNIRNQLFREYHRPISIDAALVKPVVGSEKPVTQNTAATEYQDGSKQLSFF